MIDVRSRLFQGTALCPYPLISTGLSHEDKKFRHDCKIVDWDIKQQQKISDFKFADKWCRCNIHVHFTESNFLN